MCFLGWGRLHGAEGEGVKIGNLALDCMEKGLEVIWQGNKLYLYGKVNESVGHLQREKLPKKT